MDHELKCILNAVLIATLLNLALPMLLSPYATSEEKSPSNGPGSLDMKGQFMHMMVHHGMTPVSSGLIVALITGLAVYLGYVLKPIETLQKLM
jgi:hypothetical protein|tara:strand:+ start:996 stop:1274 length:279 start_codon:yes stop_codon:yes gene_type:complete